MASNIPVIVQGNSFSLAIPLQIYYINEGQMDLQDYTPDPTDDVTVQLKGSRRNYTYTPTIDGNVANIDLTGNELADNYSVVVSIVKDNGQRLRSFRTDQFFIVESSDDLTTDDIIQGLEENVIYLNSSIFVAGEDGRGIEGIQKTGTSGLVDTYTIYYTDNTTSTFQVTNGANGQAGAQGADGVGITSIEKTGTSGLVDTYTITLSNGQTSTFEVTNGKDGVDLGLATIVDNLVDGGSTNVLSAQQGVVLKGMIDNSIHIDDSDKVILNQPLLDQIGVEDVDYTIIEDMKFSAWNGNITSATGNYLVLVTMKNGLISYKGLSISGYHGWWTADVKPSTSDPTVDEDGNAITYTKGYYNTNAKNNVAVSKSYLLFDAGTDVSNLVLAFLSFVPTPIYDIKSVNGGIRVVSSSIDGVDNITMQLLQQGIATKRNVLDNNCVINGMKFNLSSPYNLIADSGYSVYIQPIPNGAKNVLVRGLRGTGNFVYHSVYILNDSLSQIANSREYGTSVINQYISLASLSGASYVAFDASGANVANSLDDVIILFDVPMDYSEWLVYHNNFNDEEAGLSLPMESVGLKNYLADDYVTAINSSRNGYTFVIDGITKPYMTLYLPQGAANTTTGSFVQYDSNGDTLKSEAIYSAESVNFGKNPAIYKQIHLASGCTKVKLQVSFGLDYATYCLEQLALMGNRILFSDRQMEWGYNKITSINNIPLNHYAKTPLDGKLICCMGDSITDFGSTSTDGSYAWYIQKKFDCGVANYGRGNAHFCDVANTDPTANTNPGDGNTSSSPNNVVSTQVRWCIGELTADNIIPDAVILSGCTNDAFSTPNLGDLDTALAAYPMTNDTIHTDFYGAAVYMVSKLRIAWPSTKIFFATPPRSLDPTQMSNLLQYIEAMRNVAKALGCGIIDFYDESLVQYPTATFNAGSNTWSHNNPMYNTNDVVHPSQLGVNKMGQLASAKLSEYLQ